MRSGRPVRRCVTAWYDRSVGLRTYRLAYILDVIAREGAETAPDDVVRDLVGALVFHQELLSVAIVPSADRARSMSPGRSAENSGC